MTHALVTGAHGFLGQALCASLRKQLDTGELHSLTMTDRGFDGLADEHDIRVNRVAGDFGDATVQARMLATPPDIVFHLAGITSRQAEDDLALGLAVNVTHTLAFLEHLRVQGRCPVVVYTSTIGVFGAPMPERITDDTVPAPTMSYGAQKRMLEIWLADLSRRSIIDARSVRISSVAVRPSQPGGALSAFASDLIREPAEGRRYICPVSPEASLWMVSRQACVEHLLLASRLSPHQLPDGRAWTLPTLRVIAVDLMSALSRYLQRPASELVEYQPQPALQAQFANWPPIDTDIADRLGFQHDGNVDQLIARALTPL